MGNGIPHKVSFQYEWNIFCKNVLMKIFLKVCYWKPNQSFKGEDRIFSREKKPTASLPGRRSIIGQNEIQWNEIRLRESHAHLSGCGSQ